jgi:hypothetical protein
MLIGVGLILLSVGIVMGGFSGWKFPLLALLLSGMGGAATARVHTKCYQWKDRWALRRAARDESELASELSPQLFGEYSPYVIEAAQQLGAARDTTAVPALMKALELSVDSQRPGWREVAEALAQSLAQIGDGRALPLLRQLENVRGIGFIPAIREAIAAIEPQSVLLRPGNLNDVNRSLLLRPTQSAHETEPSLLLRSAESD